MGQFMFFAILLAALAVAFAISALWQQSRSLALALAVSVPLAAATVYYLKGEPAALDPAIVAAPETMDQAIAQLEFRVARDPSNLPDQVMLARSYMAVSRFEQARDTYARALALKPDESDIAVEYAEALLRSSSDRRFPPKAVALLETAVARNPQNQRALFFLGLHQMQNDRPAEAAATWEKLLPLLPPQTAAALVGQIASARAAAGLPPMPADTIGPALEVSVQLDPTLAGLARPGAMLFVFARSLDGAGPPLAAKRVPVKKFPVSVSLSDADSPMPAARLSSQKRVQLVARLSMSGDATAMAGDIEADPVQVDTAGGNATTLVLNRPVP